MSYTLFGQRGFGSTCVEAVLELAGLDYDFVEADPLGDAANRNRVASINPVGQVPALILPNDDVLTETVAILVYLGDLHPDETGTPAPDDPRRPEFLRWLNFLSSNIYPTFTISDGPARFHPDPANHAALIAQANERRKHLWGVMNDAFAGLPAPYLLGSQMTPLDVYTAMMSHWSPRREWFFEHCPNLSGAVRATETNPVIRRVWDRNFNLEVAG